MGEAEALTQYENESISIGKNICITIKIYPFKFKVRILVKFFDRAGDIKPPTTGFQPLLQIKVLEFLLKIQIKDKILSK